jgi:hypothetical protein
MTTMRCTAIAAMLALAASGCSISHSSKSLSESSHGSSESSQSSSESSGDKPDADTAYRDDVRAQTVSFVDSGESLDAFQASLGEVARRYGIVDWEARQATYVGIGQGLAAANVDAARLVALERELAGDDAARRSALRRGYDTGR